MITFDRAVFYDAVRPMFGGKLDQEQVDGIEVILDFWERGEAPSGSDDIRWLAYELATVFHETGQMMQPIEEWGRGEGKEYGQIDPETGQGYWGRGLVQITWRENYAKATEELGLSNEDDLEWHADRALDPEIAVSILFEGMSEGWFTGKGLPDYFNDTLDDPYNARRVVNGTDCADKIKGYHETFLSALKTSAVEDEDEGDELPVIRITLPADRPVRLIVSYTPPSEVIVTPLPEEL